MFRVVVECDAYGLPPGLREQAVEDVAEEFSHRPWHSNVHCFWNSNRITLEAENDFDQRGLALSDEFSDALAASIALNTRLGNLRVVSVTEF